MSRVGKSFIIIPSGVKIQVKDQHITATGPKGELTYLVHPDITVELKEEGLHCSVRRKSKSASALWGTNRARLANIIKGVSGGFVKELEFLGVGYKAQVKGKNLELAVGFSHPVVIEAPEGISFSVDQQIIKVEGIDKVKVGQMAANIRAVRKPEPYKGKGIRYRGEHVRRKVGKVVGTTQ